MNERRPTRLAGHVVEGNVLHVWEVERLWRLSRELEIIDVSIDDLPEFDSDEPWYGYGADRPTCRSVAKHARRIQDCDLAVPIVLSSDNHVLDGMHRVAKAWTLGLKTVSAVRFDEPVDPDLVLELKGGVDPQEIIKQFSNKVSEALERPSNTTVALESCED